MKSKLASLELNFWLIIIAITIFTVSACGDKNTEQQPVNTSTQPSNSIVASTETTVSTLSPTSEKPSTENVPEKLVTILDLIITPWEAKEAWACIAEAGEPMGFTFYDYDTVDGMEKVRLGIQFYVRPDLESKKFVWRATSNSSVVLEFRAQKQQDDWQNVRFSTDSEKQMMLVESDAYGETICRLERNSS